MRLVTEDIPSGFTYRNKYKIVIAGDYNDADYVYETSYIHEEDLWEVIKDEDGRVLPNLFELLEKISSTPYGSSVKTLFEKEYDNEFYDRYLPSCSWDQSSLGVHHYELRSICWIDSNGVEFKCKFEENEV